MKTYQIDEKLLDDLLTNLEDYQYRLTAIRYFIYKKVDEDLADAERLINKLKELKDESI